MKNSTPKIVDKSIILASQLFPSAYADRGSNQCYHFAFIFKRNKLVSIGQNDYDYNSKALYFAKLFSAQKRIKFPGLHAEIDAISKLWGKVHIDSTYKMVVIRLNKFGKLQNSKPCDSCITVLNAIGVNQVWYSTRKGVEYGI